MWITDSEIHHAASESVLYGDDKTITLIKQTDKADPKKCKWIRQFGIELKISIRESRIQILQPNFGFQIEPRNQWRFIALPAHKVQ